MQTVLHKSRNEIPGNAARTIQPGHSYPGDAFLHGAFRKNLACDTAGRTVAGVGVIRSCIDVAAHHAAPDRCPVFHGSHDASYTESALDDPIKITVFYRPLLQVDGDAAAGRIALHIAFHREVFDRSVHVAEQPAAEERGPVHGQSGDRISASVESPRKIRALKIFRIGDGDPVLFSGQVQIGSQFNGYVLIAYPGVAAVPETAKILHAGDDHFRIITIDHTAQPRTGWHHIPDICEVPALIDVSVRTGCILFFRNPQDVLYSELAVLPAADAGRYGGGNDAAVIIMGKDGLSPVITMCQSTSY